MSFQDLQRPDVNATPSFYKRYVESVPDGNVIDTLKNQSARFLHMLSALDESQAAIRYLPSKWSIKQIVGHLIDAERVFVYRALTFCRQLNATLPGFDENVWVESANFDSFELQVLLSEMKAVRKSTILFFEHQPFEMWRRTGEACSVTFSVQMIAYIIAGHEKHHENIICERYLPLLGKIK